MRVDDDETIIEIIFAWINDVLMHLSIEIENRRPAGRPWPCECFDGNSELRVEQ